MARPKKVIEEVVKVKEEVNKIHCSGCDKDRKETEFYKSYGSTASGILPFCKHCCISKGLDSNGSVNLEKFKQLLTQVDRPYIHSLFVSNMNKYPKVASAIGFYFKDLGMVQNRNLRYKDSLFESNNSNDIEQNINKVPYATITSSDRNRLTERWGYGYTDEELYSFEKKYDLLKNNYPQKTAMHTEALLTYIRYRGKEEMATAKGDVGEAQKWGGLADKASERAKINPSQLSKADLTGGLNGFGELARAVEKAIDIIEILPKFKQQPQDVVDFTLWCYINYCRRMKNLPDTEYKDIYKFYEDRKEEYKQNKNREFQFEDEEGELNG